MITLCRFRHVSLISKQLTTIASKSSDWLGLGDESLVGVICRNVKRKQNRKLFCPFLKVRHTNRFKYCFAKVVTGKKL